MNTFFDKEFDKIDTLTWYPWVGDGYKDTDTKILVIGESHYATYEDGEYDEDTDKAFCKNKNITREFVKENVIFENPKIKFYRNMPKFLTGDQISNKELFSQISFYNFIQRPAKRVRGDLKREDFNSAWFTWLETIKILRPTACIFCGISMQKQFLEVNRSISKSPCWEDIEGTNFTHIGKKIRPIKGKFIVDASYSTDLLFVQHPSAMNNPLDWNKFLIDYFKRKYKENFLSLT